MTNMELNRRSFIVTAAAAGGGLLLGVGSASAAVVNATPWMAPTDKDGTEVSHWVSIDPEGVVTMRQAQQEMGQGTFTGNPQMLAEEMHVDWNMVRVQYVDVNRHVNNDNLYGRMSTVGSGGTRRSRVALQQAGASVRERMKAAAAAAWGVNPSQVAAKDSVLSSGNNTGTFAEFATAAAQIALAEEPEIKTPDQFTLIGTSVARLDTPLKVNGSAQHAIDARVPGMVYAAVKCCPVPWGRFLSGRGQPDPFDPETVLDRPGVIQVVQMEMENGSTSSSAFRTSVAVVADTWYRAKTALDLLSVNWNFGTAVHVSNEGLFARGSTMLGRNGQMRRDDGDALGIIGSSSNVITSDYQRPYEAHARMEPSSATVSVSANRADAFVSSQNPPSQHRIVADMTGFDPKDVYTHNHFLGDGFGGGGPVTLAIRHATQIAIEAGVPVKTVFSREEA